MTIKEYQNITISSYNWVRLKAYAASVAAQKLKLRNIVDEALTIYLDEKQRVDK